VKQNNDGILYLFKKNKVSFFHGRGSFVKAAAEAAGRSQVGGETLVTGKQVVVATGSSARALPGAPFDEERSSATTARCASAPCPASWA
jgi:dihydrolipoamide dehydrogenase